MELLIRQDLLFELEHIPPLTERCYTTTTKESFVIYLRFFREDRTFRDTKRDHLRLMSVRRCPGN